jgi:hypothetical protein
MVNCIDLLKIFEVPGLNVLKCYEVNIEFWEKKKKEAF